MKHKDGFVDTFRTWSLRYHIKVVYLDQSRSLLNISHAREKADVLAGSHYQEVAEKGDI